MMETAKRIAELVDAKGGRTYFVGGTVRDELLGRSLKDVDVEVFGLTRVELEEVLSAFGKVSLVGKSFGVYKVGEVDVALPRREEKVGFGHKGFKVVPDGFMSVRKAMVRRDFTMNAIYKDVLTGELVDYFGGLKDLDDKVI